MYRIYFFKNDNGSQPIKQLIIELSNKKDKNSKITVNKIKDYIKALSINGTRIGKPYVKHIEDKIWELRPTDNRIFFVGWRDNSFILLHHFVKKTQKTPKREIEQAKRNFKKILSNGEDNYE